MKNNCPPVIVRGLYKAFHGQPVLRGIDLELPSGELTGIVGRSGCGKSTLLRCLNGLERMDQGTITYGDLRLERSTSAGARDRVFETEARAIRRSFGMVFQSFNLFPHLTVLENLTLAPIQVRGTARAAAEGAALGLLEKVGLKSHAHHLPAELSGGQQQRAAIARALAMSPSVMLYDEPTSALDPLLVEEVFQVMRRLAAEGMTQVVVTHEMRFVREVASRIVYMEDGNVVEVGEPERLFRTPSDERTARYLNARAFSPDGRPA